MNLFNLLICLCKEINPRFLKRLVLSLILFFSGEEVLYASDLKLRIGYNDNASFPYFLGNSSLPFDPPGISVEIISIVASELGVDVEFVRLPGRRVLHELKANRLDAAFIFSFKPERQEFGVFPMRGGQPDSQKRLAVLSYVLYRLKGTALDWNGHSFSNLNGALGANAGYSIVADLRKKGVVVVEAKTTETNFLNLENTRIVGVADQEVVADSYLATNNINTIEKVEVPLATKDYFLIFSHQFVDDYPDLAEKFWERIAEKRDELTEQLIPKYVAAVPEASLSN